jgi:hypothetical protein
MGSEIWLFLIFLLFQNKQQKTMPATAKRLGITPATMNLAGLRFLEELAGSKVGFLVAEVIVVELMGVDMEDDSVEVDGMMVFVSFFI